MYNLTFLWNYVKSIFTSGDVLESDNLAPPTSDIDAAILVGLILLSLFIIFVIIRNHISRR